ncbi:MAG: aquaporin [Ferruginibacter sp.]
MADAVPYWISQVIGAVAAWVVVSLVFEGGPATPSIGVASVPKALVAEILGTFALAYVVLNVATAKATSGNSNYGLAIGFTVLCCAYAFGSFSGGAFNPAVAIGVTLMKGMVWTNISIYLIGCFSGAALAALVFNMNNPDDK